MREQSSRTLRLGGAGGVLGAVFILVGLYLVTMGASGAPAKDAAAGAWADWARQQENAVEVGVYLLLVPGLLLVLFMFAVLASLLPRDSIASRLAGYGAVAFVVLFATASVMASTASSTSGFYPAYQDPTAVTVFTFITAGYHLQAVGTWALSVTMAATAVALRSEGAPRNLLFWATIVLVTLAVLANFIGFGVIFGVIWIAGAGVGLLRWRRPLATTALSA